MQAGLGESPALDAPRALRGVQRAAVRVVLAWLAALGVAILVALALMLVAVYAVVYIDELRPLGIVWSLICLAAVYNCARFVPRRTRATPAPIEADGVAEVSDWIADQCGGWRPRLRLTPAAEMAAAGDDVWLGRPLLACLREPELSCLVRDHHEQWSREQSRAVRAAEMLAGAGIGRGIEIQYTGWVNRRTLSAYGTSLERLAAARQVHREVLRAAQGEEWEQTVARTELVIEGWDVMIQNWLVPAARLGVWHHDLDGGLRAFLDACEEAGVLGGHARPPGRDVWLALPALQQSDQALSEELVEGLPHDPVATSWVDHPSAVTEPTWRVQLAAGMVAVERATGRVVPASVEALLRLLDDGWGPTLEVLLRQASDEPDQESRDETGPSAVDDLLTAAVSLAILDSSVGVLRWRWPTGAVLVAGHDGTVLPVRAMVTGPHDGLVPWLRTLGVDPDAPLLMAGHPPTGPEYSIAAFGTSQRLSSRVLVVTDRAVRLFARTQRGALLDIGDAFRHGPSRALGRYVEAVDRHDLSDELTSVRFDDVVRATLSPQIGGHWWRLRLRTATGEGLVVRGDGSGHELDDLLAPLLGERLHTHWLHAPRWARAWRNLTGFICLGLGGFVALTGLLGGLWWLARGNDVRVEQAPDLAALGLAILAVGFAPDILAALVRRTRGTPRDRLADLDGPDGMDALTRAR